VILVDANLLVYAYAREVPQNEAARDWLDEQLNGTFKVGLPWPSLLAFTRLISNPRIFERPVTPAQGWRQVIEWLDLPRTWVPLPTDQHGQILARLIDQIGSRSNLVPDAHLAALALEHGLTLCSSDGDYARFSQLDWLNPLA
jgi:toxin-antitoxin system PIN domain toxin